MNVRIAHLASFNAGNWIDDHLEMTQYTVKIWMITQTSDAEEQSIAVRRLRHFIYTQLESTVFIDAAQSDKCVELTLAGLNITTLPEKPAEQLVGIMLFHKLNAIMEERIAVLEIEISAGDAVIYLHGDHETSENLTVPDWWTVSDLTHSDIVLTESDKVVSIPQATPWRELDLAWPESVATDVAGNIVVFANFKPADDTK